MKAVRSLTGALVPLEAAAKDPINTWICVSCGERIHVYNNKKGPVVTHAKACTSPSPLDIKGMSNMQISARVAAIVAQKWVVEMGGVTQKGLSIDNELMPIERVKNVVTIDYHVPLVLVEGYVETFWIGIVFKESHFQELIALANMTGVPTLAVVSEDVSYAKITQLICEDSSAHVWLRPPTNVRKDSRPAEFLALARMDFAKTKALSNRKAEHYSPIVPQSRLQFLQDMVRDTRANRWNLRAKRLIFTTENGLSSNSWVVAGAIRVPYFWLRYWVIKRSLFQVGKLVDASDLAMNLVAYWHKEHNWDLVDDIKDIIEMVLEELTSRRLLSNKGAKGVYSCAQKVL